MRVSNFFNAPVVDDALIRKRATRLCSRKIIQKILTYLIFYVGVAYFVVHFPAILFLSWDKVTITAACTQYTTAYILYTERNGPPRCHLLQTSKICRGVSLSSIKVYLKRRFVWNPCIIYKLYAATRVIGLNLIMRLIKIQYFDFFAFSPKGACPSASLQ